MPTTNRDVTLKFHAPWPITIPAGTRVRYVGTNGGIKTTTQHAVDSVEDLVRAGADRFTAQHYYCWIPDDAVSA